MLDEIERTTDGVLTRYAVAEMPMRKKARNHNEEPKKTFENGATRSDLIPRYDLVPKAAIDGMARRLELGARKHGENNWRGGGTLFVAATKNHLIAHVLRYLESGEQEDLDAIGANYAFLAHFREKGIA